MSSDLVIPEQLSNGRGIKEKGKCQQVSMNIYKLTRGLDGETKGAIIGGKTVPRCKSWTSKDIGKPYAEIDDYKVYMDIVGMYGCVQVEAPLPCGEWSLIDDVKECNEWLSGFIFKSSHLNNIWLASQNKDFPLTMVKVTYTNNPHDLEPAVGRHPPGKIGIAWDVGVEVTDWVTSVDLWLILRHGGTVAKVHKMIKWKTRGRPYRKWIQKCAADKKSAGENNEPGKRKQAKLRANANYGTTLKRDFDNVFVVVSTLSELEQYHMDFDWVETCNWDNVWDYRQGQGPCPEMLLLKGMRRVNMDWDVTSQPRYHGTFILSWSRVMLNAMMDAVNPDSRSGTLASISQQPLYGDTDSFIFDASAIPRLLPFFGESPGQINDELADKSTPLEYLSGKMCKIVDFRATRPKWYGLQFVRPNGEIGEVVKCASMNLKDIELITPDTEESCYDMKFARFKDVCDHHSDGAATTSKYKSVVRNKMKKHGTHLTFEQRSLGIRPFDITNVDETHKTMFATPYTGRTDYPPPPVEVDGVDVNMDPMADDDDDDDGGSNDNSNITKWTVPNGWQPVPESLYSSCSE